MHPYVADYLDFLTQQPPLLGLAAIAAGVLFLTNGWKLFKLLIAGDAVLLGMQLGTLLGQRLDRPYMDIILGVGMGMIFAALVWPLMKGAVCVLGALFGAGIGYFLWITITGSLEADSLVNHAWVGGLVGLITMGLLSFIIFRTVAVVVTSFQGSFLLISGLGCLALAIDGLRENLIGRIQSNPIIVPVMIFIPGALGVIYQESKFLTLQAKKRKAAMAKG